MQKYTTVAAYLKDVPPQAAERVAEMRAILSALLPHADEVISYNMPACKLNGKVVVYYAAYKAHIGLYPHNEPIEAYAAELAKYKTSKGAIQFPLDKPLPKVLIRKIVRHAAQLAAERAKKK
ncbi:hypothetical protein CAP35_13080 [Chitinophagaceae bacterium IBVUCB1]|nr:hypothetical protein CAP35_13080 [Chitinophagaceae bacterium IBVUCB1]